MNISVLRKQLLFVILALIFSVALPVHAARFRRVYFFQTDIFQVASNATITVGTNHKASLAEIRVGDRVNVGYEKEDGALVVHQIADGVPHKAPNPSATTSNKTSSNASAKLHPHGNGESLHHVHGIVRAVDVHAGTVTIAYRLR